MRCVRNRFSESSTTTPPRVSAHPMKGKAQRRAAYYVFLLSALLFAAAAGRAVWFAAGPLLFGPRMKCAQRIHDFGMVQVGSESCHEFVIANDGQTPLVIDSVQPACAGCTEWELDRTIIQPGDSAILAVRITWPVLRGRQRKDIVVASNDRRHPFLPLSLEATLTEDVQEGVMAD